jgi:2-polyprenyl-3-methyl-5-hydroxy-6-metoxy-1,4-benzoquinol methylase
VTNDFPAIWFDTFLSPENAAPVDRELAFIQKHLPAARYPRLLDVPCGIGRHSGPLASLGYEVLGIDRSEAALAMARQRHPEVEFRKLDMFELRTLARTFDGVLCLWQSFGYGNAEQNRGLLVDMRQVLRPGGRILLDIYNADAAALMAPTTTEQRSGRTIRTHRSWIGRRLHVELEYSDVDQVDQHEWEIFRPAEIKQLAADVGLDVLVCCAWFDPALPPSRDHLRMQLLLERRQ